MQLYRINYRKFHGVIFGNMKLYQQGSFVSAIPKLRGTTAFCSELDTEVEVMQCVPTRNVE